MAIEIQDAPMPLASLQHEDSNTSAPKPLRRACDCCRKRKVKCDGSDPCTPCKKASIRCAYLQPPKKKGPKGLRSARVLHALRRIDDGVASPTSPLSPEQQAFGSNWQWNTVPNGVHYQHQAVSQPPEVAYGPHTSVPPDQSYFQQMPTSMPRSTPPQPQPQPRIPSIFKEDYSQGWAPHSDTLSNGSPIHPGASPSDSDTSTHRLYPGSFLPFMHLFFNHMFPIMPIIDRSIYLDPSFYSHQFSSDMYSFLSSICAATVAQLADSNPHQPILHPNKRNDDIFALECLRERRTHDYVENMSTLSVMTSFFLFAYYGNNEKHAKAWHYLQEAITFLENLNMDDEASYAKVDPVEGQWRRRLYWLLFITERAYAVQRRKHTRLHTSVHLPSVFDSEDPQVLNGFTLLANLFSAVDDNFVRAWRGLRRQSLCNEEWLAETQKQLDAAALALGGTNETQQLDIAVTREWLHVLAWQMGVSNGLIWGKGEGGMRLDYPVELARKVVELTSGANASALDSHGIGMEQKLSDIAGCLADVLKCTAGDTSATFLEGKEYLNILLNKLGSMRGKESRYLKPLMAKMDGLMGYEISNQTLPLPTETTASYPTFSSGLLTPQRLSMADSIGMLRTLSMSGSLGMPGLSVQLEDWTQRRPSGKVYNEAETNAMDPWMLNAGVAQRV